MARARKATESKTPPPVRADRALLLADAERLENFDHAGGMCAALCGAPGRYFQRRAVRAGIFGRSRRTIAFRQLSIRPARADGRFPCSSPAPFFSISAARPASSIRARSARGSPSRSGCSGRWAGSARWPARLITSAATRREQLPYAVDRYTNEVNRLFGVMNKRLAGRDFLAGRYSIADMACVGWVRLAERMGQDLGAISRSQALVRNHPGAACGQARVCHPHRGGRDGRHPRSESARGPVRAAGDVESSP